MNPPVVPRPSQTPPPGIDRSLNQDDDADHVPDDGGVDAGHDVRYESTVRDKPGLAGSASINFDFDFGPDQERRRH